MPFANNWAKVVLWMFRWTIRTLFISMFRICPLVCQCLLFLFFSLRHSVVMVMRRKALTIFGYRYRFNKANELRPGDYIPRLLCTRSLGYLIVYYYHRISMSQPAFVSYQQCCCPVLVTLLKNTMAVKIACGIYLLSWQLDEYHLTAYIERRYFQDRNERSGQLEVSTI